MLRRVVLSLTALLPLVSTLPVSAAETYAAPLRVAVRQLPVAAENNAGSDRKLWGGWIDADRDCHNTRQEVLIAEGTGVSLSSRGRTVSRGRWHNFFDDGKAHTDPAQLQIDHFVPVAEAWGSGARAWPQPRRVAFYNDLGVGYALNAMPARLNQSKQASQHSPWLGQLVTSGVP